MGNRLLKDGFASLVNHIEINKRLDLVGLPEDTQCRTALCEAMKKCRMEIIIAKMSKQALEAGRNLSSLCLF